MVMHLLFFFIISVIRLNERFLKSEKHGNDFILTLDVGEGDLFTFDGLSDFLTDIDVLDKH